MARIVLSAGLALVVLCGCATGTRQFQKAGGHVDLEAYAAKTALLESDEWDVPPRLVSGKRPIYPISRLMAGASGNSVIVFTIGTDGRTRDFEVEHTDDQWYANHAIAALSEWVFEPARKDGQPVEARFRQSFEFGLR